MGTRKQFRDLKRLVATLSNDFEIAQQSNGHIRITVNGPLGSRFVIAAGTASDYRASRNLSADLARAVLEVNPADPALIQPKSELETVSLRVLKLRRARQ
jgi:hypothetical protein